MVIIIGCLTILARLRSLSPLVSSYAGRVRIIVIMILMASTLVILWCLMTCVPASDHLTCAHLITSCLTAHYVWTAVRAHLSHIVRIVAIQVELTVVTTVRIDWAIDFGRLTTVRPTNYRCRHRSLLDSILRCFLLTLLLWAEHAHLCCLL